MAYYCIILFIAMLLFDRVMADARPFLEENRGVCKEIDMFICSMEADEAFVHGRYDVK